MQDTTTKGFTHRIGLTGLGILRVQRSFLWLACLGWLTLSGADYQTQPLHPLEASSDAGPLFERLTPQQTGVDFRMTLPEVSERFRELLQLAALGGITTGDYDQDGLSDFFVSSPLGGSQLYRNLGGFRFEEVTQAAGLDFAGFWATGSNFIDIDNDGLLDLYVCGYRMPNRLYLNQGPDPSGITHFREAASDMGLAFNGGSMQMYFADIDLDGDLDAYLATTAIPPPPGVKFQVRFEGNKPVVPEELKEYWGLIYLPGEKAHPSENGQYDHLFLNEGDKFREITQVAGIDGPYLTLGAIWWDFNQDRWPDLYVANDYLGPDMLYLNQRDGTFKEVIKERIPHTPWSSMGVDIGDLNNDGWMDLIACDMMGSSHYRRQVMLGEGSQKAWFLSFAEPRQYSRNAVYLNTGTERFMEVAFLSGMAATDWTWAPRIEDYDLDGRVDVFFTNGMLRDVQHSDLANYADRTFKGGTPEWADFWSGQPIRKEQNQAYRNLGNLQFEAVAHRWGLDHLGVSFGSATADFDNDGDLDMVVNDADGPIQMLRNRASKGHRLMVRLQGQASPRQGIGATLTLEAQGLKQTRQVVAGRGWLSGSDPTLHFGLGAATEVDHILVQWPSGASQELKAIQADQVITIMEPSNPTPPASNATTETAWFSAKTLEKLSRKLGSFDDLSVQPLAPRRLSQGQLATAWGDLNGDGLPDGFLGGEPGQPGTLHLSQGPLQYTSQALEPATHPGPYCQSDAALVDLDGDQDLDLILSYSALIARAPGKALEVWLNDGKGQMTHQAEGSPKLPAAIQCMALMQPSKAPAQTLLFLGGSSLPGQYPVGSPSYLLAFESGQWKDLTPESMRKPWLVQDACWADMDGDDTPELILALEWGTLEIFKQSQNQWQRITSGTGLEARSGWWTHLSALDVDADGDLDLIAGNRGLNTAYQPTLEEPDWLIYGDLNKDGRPELVETYGEGGTQYPRRGFEALSRSLPSLREQFINFHQFAASSLTDMFEREALAGSFMVRANTAESGVWINQGNATFAFRPLPRLAQAAPILDVSYGDFNADGRVDLVLAQNDHSIQDMHGRMDGGIGLILLGDQDQLFVPADSRTTGIVMEADTRFVEAMDLNGDQLTDLLFGGPNIPMRAFLRQ